MCETRFVKCVRMRLPFRRPWDLLPYRRLYRGFSFVAFPILCSASPRLVSVSSLCPVSLSRLSRPVFSFPCFSVSPCPAPLFRSLRVSLISPLPASLSAFYLLRLLPYSIFFLSSSLCAPLCSLPFFIPASSPHLSSSLLLLLLPLSSLSEMPVETVFEKSRISLPAASCGVCFVFDANVVNFPLL